MRIYYILPALACLLCIAAARADDTGSGAGKAEAPPWYQVELVVFAHHDTSDKELWRDDPGAPDLSHALQLSPAASSPALIQRLEALPPADVQGQALADFLQGDTAKDDSAAVAFRLLPDGAQQLQDAVTRLNGADGYRVLYHAAWRQPVYGPEKAVAVRLRDDPYGTQAAMLRSLDQASAASGDVNPPAAAPEPGENDTSGTASGDGQAAAAPMIWLLDGSVELTQSRYLHLDVDLIYQVRAPAEAGDAGGPGARTGEAGSVTADNSDTAGSTDTEVTHTYRMQQSRRILNDNLYYFDHPEFGLLAEVSPYQPPPPPAPASAPPAGQTADQPAPANPQGTQQPNSP